MTGVQTCALPILEIGEVLVDGRERRQAEAAAHFLETRRVAVLLDEFLQVVQNLALTLGEWLHGATLPKKKRKFNDLLRHRCGSGLT